MRIDSIATEVEGKRNDSQQLFDMAVATLEGFTTSFDQQNMSVYQAKKMATDALTMAMYIYEKAKNLSLSIDALNASISHLMDLETSVGEETQKTDEVIADVMRVVQMVEERLNMTDVNYQNDSINNIQYFFFVLHRIWKRLLAELSPWQTALWI